MKQTDNQPTTTTTTTTTTPTTTTTTTTASDGDNAQKKSRRVKKSKSKNAQQDTQPLSKSIYILCFVSMAQIETYLKAHGLLKGHDNLANQQEFSQLSKSIMTNSKSYCAI